MQMFKALKDAFVEPEPEPGFEEGVPPAGGKLQTELEGLKLRPLIRRAEQWGVDDEKLDAAKTTDTIVALIVEKMRAEGASLEPGVPRVVKPCSCCSTFSDIAARLQVRK